MSHHEFKSKIGSDNLPVVIYYAHEIPDKEEGVIRSKKDEIVVQEVYVTEMDGRDRCLSELLQIDKIYFELLDKCVADFRAL